ncbi:MAG: sn-glycerol-3-phosphate ABC transporter ATP-binding protein UgpC [Kordiimonadaceae bacterium]|jgi:multiple sugar transport system ATP-binding protein|nr:sn-glycerol-3-phosphate ABC transporter ATP-binding protein UgpC [Kordiimonadaceae bacterium]MBT6033215.1 sn-glycerol-3-phosphate ABC transporter ATP-binding protein UgpC [Kordiimonadaceae bacterium]
MAAVNLKNIKKSYDKTKVLHGIDLEIADKEFVVLVGPSGCGKSTLLRMIAGLEGITEGEISIGDRVVNDLEPKDRNIAMVFQNYALYPHMSVFKNISFGLRAAKLPKAKIKKKVEAAAEILELSDLLERKPAQLSGGQRQRVSMGRAIVRDPSVFLFDEPLSNLDAKLRSTMRVEIKKLHEKVKTTIIYVTHDQVEAMTLADRIVILKDGMIQQVGTPMEVYNNPANKFVASFIGSPEMNFIKQANGTEIGIRPENIYLSDTAPQMTNPIELSGVISVIETLGAETLITATCNNQELTLKTPGLVTLNIGTEITLTYDMANAHVFESGGTCQVS